jgi:hypothetical protein
MSWAKLEAEAPELAAFGAQRYQEREVAYLATIKKDGSPRVHPITPILGSGRLFVFMEPTSPKGHDLRRDGRYALHSAVADSSGSNGEFILSGRARLVEDPATRAAAAQAASYTPAERYILFELEVEAAQATEYAGDEIRRRNWKSS